MYWQEHKRKNTYIIKRAIKLYTYWVYITKMENLSGCNVRYRCYLMIKLYTEERIKMMKFTLEMNLQRIVTMIDLLESEEKVEISALSTLINASKKTLLGDIELFNTIYEPFRFETDNYYYWLVYPKGYSVRDLLSMILSQSKAVDILWGILLKKYTLLEAAENFFCSQSNIRRIINRYNDEFEKKNWDIKIVTKPFLHLIGTEELIRQLYQHLILERYGLTLLEEVPGLSELYEELVYFVNITFKKDKDLIDCYSITLILFIASCRQRQNFYKTVPSTLKNKIYTKFIVQMMKKNTVLESHLWKTLEFKLNVKSVSDILIIDTPSLIPKLYLEHQPSYYRNKCLGISYLDVVLFLKVYFEKIDLTVENLETSSIWLYNVIGVQLSIPYYLYNKNHFFKMNVYNNYQKEVDIFFELVNNTGLFNNSKYSEYLIDELFFNVVMATPELADRLLHVFEKKKILLVSSRSKLLTYRLQTVIKRKYPQISVVDIYLDSLRKINIDKLKHYDVIVSDFPLDVVQISNKVVQFSFSDTKKFWNDFEMLLK